MSEPTLDIPGIGRPGIPGLDMPFGSSLSLGRPRLDLGDYTLRLDPQIEADLASLRMGAASASLRRRWLDPDWGVLDRAALMGRRTGGAGYGMCAWSAPGPGPAQPRAGTAGDALRAVYRVPCVRQYVDERLTMLERRGTAIWDNASTGGKVGIVAGGIVVVGGGVVGGIALGPLSGVDLPVPGVPGVSARVTLGPDVVPEGMQIPNPDGAWSFGLTVDLAKIFPALQ